MNDQENFFKYYKMKYLEISKSYPKKTMQVFSEASLFHEIDVELLFGIVTLEKLNRGDLLNRYLEKVIYFFSPQTLVKKDMSIGVGQIKLSTIKKTSKYETDRSLLKKMINPQTNIVLVAKVIQDILNNLEPYVDLNDITLKNIVSCYLTGSEKTRTNPQIMMHVNLLKWSINNQLFRKRVENRF